MSRAWALLVAVIVVAAHPRAFEPAAESSAPVLQQFLTADDSAPASYKALRHLEAGTQRFSSSAWMDVWTEAGPGAFHYTVAGEGGSESIRSKVFRALLETERKSWNAGGHDRSGITPQNYNFADEVAPADGLTRLGVKARRKDVLLVDGSILLQPEDGDLVLLEGKLSKAPSFWTRRVHIVRRYSRVSGVRVPVALESVADIVLYGRATLTMTYQYESINGQRIGRAPIQAAAAVR